MFLLLAIWMSLDYSILSIYALMFSKVKSNKLANVINKLSGFVLACVAIYASCMMAIKLYFGTKLLVKN